MVLPSFATKTLVLPRKIMVLPRKTMVLPRKTRVSPRKTIVLPRKTMVLPRKTMVLHTPKKGGPGGIRASGGRGGGVALCDACVLQTNIVG